MFRRHRADRRRTIAIAAVAVTAVMVGMRADAAAAEGGAPHPSLRFYAPFDDHARGILLPQGVGVEATGEFAKAAGKVHAATATPPAGLEFPLARFLSNREGSVAAWTKVNWDPKQPATRWLVNLGRFASLYRWQRQPYLTYALWYHHLDEKHDYGCTAPLAGWEPGQWHHVGLTWSWSGRRRALYLDGRKVREARIERIPNVVNLFRLGPDVAAVDELCVYGAAVDDAEIARLFAAGEAGRPAFAIKTIPPTLMAAARLPETREPKPPGFVNWSFDGAEHRDNGLRGAVTLHGWWRWQRGASAFDPPDPGRWLYRKVPAHSSFVEAFPVRDAAFKIVPAKDARVGRAKLDGLPQWCRREFVPPPDWRGRRLVLQVDSLVFESAVYLNGALLEALPRLNLGGRYDVTDRIRWGVPNVVTLLSSGVDGDVTLLSLPAGPAVEDAWLETSWRKKAITAHLRLRAGKAQAVRVTVEIADPKTQEAVKTLARRADLDPGSNTLDVAEPWQDPVPWSLARPHLYTFRVRLTSPGGERLDETFPTRFGFREIWIDGGDFLLNGVPVHFIGHSNSHLTSAAELGDREYLRYSLTHWRKAGVNCVTPWQGESRYPTLHPLLDVADELGTAILPNINLPTGERGGETRKTRDYWHRLYRLYIQRYRNHPSVLAWMIGSGAHVYDFCPGVMDGRFTPDIPRIAPLRATWTQVRAIDPTRPVFGLSNGNAGSVWTSMAYQGFDVDLQERENWPLRWSTKRHKPVMPCEFSLPCHPDWYARTDARSSKAQYHPANTQSLATEYGAMFLGPSVYTAEPADYLASVGQSPGRPNRSQAYWDTKALFADTLRAWRAYGISFVYHAEVPSFFAGKRPTFPGAPTRDPRRFGGTPERLHGSLQAADDLSPFGQRVRAATAPRMAFVGGPSEGGRSPFTLKDHAFFSGERVRKCLVIVNDTEGPLRLAARWALHDDADETAAHGQLEIDVPAGRQETRNARIEFTAPVVETRTDYVLTVSARAVGGESPAVTPVAVTVFPADKSEPVKPADLVLFDPVGRTRQALARLGIKAGPMPERLAARHRLIVGSRSLETAGGRKALADAGFDEAVADGMHALVFEQAAPAWTGTLLGLRLKRLATRRVFVRSPGHPALAGLAEADFRFLRGDSDVLEAYPGPGPMPDGYPLHFWHWGNDNIVATYTVEKPQTGAARAILDCGFDLNEAALLEAARGNGLILFCQVDVTNRAGTDPVSTRLARNLISYLCTPQRGPAAAVSLEDLLRRHPPRASFEGYVSRVPAVAGLHDGETFLRARLRLPAFDSKSPTPLFKRVEIDGRPYWMTSLSEADLKTDWQRAKRARIESALRFRNGERPLAGPTLAHADEPDRLYPIPGTRLPKLGDVDPYAYWRW